MPLLNLLLLLQELPSESRLQRARVYLKNLGVITPLDRKSYMLTSGEISSSCSLENIKKTLEQDCWKNQTGHQCLVNFRENLQSVRNWRLLWHSLPRTSRHEMLTKLFGRLSTGSKVTFLGVEVCQKAFMMLSGIGGSSLMAARHRVSTGSVSAWSPKELLQGMRVKKRSKDQRYVDAREWQVVFAEKHAEQSPVTGALMLPAGRKSLYWLQYMYEREKEPGLKQRIGAPASQSTFMTAWKRECPHIVVTKSVSMFTRCGLRDFLQTELARCPRSDTVGVNMLRMRLGQHYEFQAAQRLAMGRIEEQCRRSGGREWP